MSEGYVGKGKPLFGRDTPRKRVESERWGGFVKCPSCETEYPRTACHCSGCHRVFASVEAFDLHREWGPRNRRYCMDPAVVFIEKGKNAGKVALTTTENGDCLMWTVRRA